MIKDKDYIILSNREKLLLMKDLLLKITVGDEYNVPVEDSTILLQTIIKLIGKTNIFKHVKLTPCTIKENKQFKRPIPPDDRIIKEGEQPNNGYY